MSKQFRDLLKKVGSGTHTHKLLTRDEAQLAARLMLTQEATPAQIGAFMIAHRIRRPTGTELAGMLDAYDEFGPKLAPLGDPGLGVVVFGTPYDGRSRTAPVALMTALLLAALGFKVLLHGGERIPTKYGIPLAEQWAGLGVDVRHHSLTQVQDRLDRLGLGFVHLPHHFPQAQNLVTYRDEIGKRPPQATLELLWSPYRGEHHLIAGYVHPPTEVMMREALGLRNQRVYTLVKGLEGSWDLYPDRTTIVAVHHPQGDGYQKPSPVGLAIQSGEQGLVSDAWLVEQFKAILQGQDSPLKSAVLWNGAFYLWHLGQTESLAMALDRVQELIRQGALLQKLQSLQP